MKESSDADVSARPLLAAACVGVGICAFAFQSLQFFFSCRDGDDEGHVQAGDASWLRMPTRTRLTRKLASGDVTNRVIWECLCDNGGDTYSEESIKYIPRAPMLRAKTNTTWRRGETQTEEELPSCAKQRESPKCARVVNRDSRLVEADAVGGAAVIKRQFASYSSASTDLFGFFFFLLVSNAHVGFRIHPPDPPPGKIIKRTDYPLILLNVKLVCGCPYVFHFVQN